MRIAIVDDNVSYLKIMREYLSHFHEFEVIGTAENGVDACRIIQNEEPDVVLMDIAMPRLGGLGVLEKLQGLSLRKRPQFIIVTALGQETVSRIAVELGADFYMIKPVDLDELVFNIRHLYSLKNFKDIRVHVPGTRAHRGYGARGAYPQAPGYGRRSGSSEGLRLHRLRPPDPSGRPVLHQRHEEAGLLQNLQEIQHDARAC